MILDLPSKRILITGGGGFLGSYLVERLRGLGCRQISAPRRWECDLTQPAQIERLMGEFRPQIVIHAAATVGGIGANRDNPGRFFYENAIMGVQLIEACRVHAVEKTVVLGSVCAYPKFTPPPFREETLWDGYPEETNAPYGLAKKMLLVQCQAYREQYGMNSIFLLPVNLFGPRDNFDLNSSHVIPALVRKCREAHDSGAREIILWGDGSATREFLYVEDAAEAIILAIQKYDCPDPVNIGIGQEISIRELALKIAALTGFSGRIVWDTTKPNGQPRRCLDVSRAEKEFGFRASTSLDEGLKNTIDWYQLQRPLLVDSTSKP
jgi:GDP-L-fucose synthase